MELTFVYVIGSHGSIPCKNIRPSSLMQKEIKGRYKDENHYRGGCPGLVVKGRDSRSEGREFESRHHIMDGHFFRIYLL